MSHIGVPTVWENLVIDGIVNSTFTTILLQRSLDNATIASNISAQLVPNGQICVGCLVSLPASLQTSGSAVIVPVLTDETNGRFYGWEGQSQGVVLNGQLIRGTAGPAIMDTGTSFMFLPTTLATIVANAMGATILSDGSFAIPKTAITNSFTFGFAFEGKAFYIDIRDLVRGYADDQMTFYSLAIRTAEIPDAFGNDCTLVSLLRG